MTQTNGKVLLVDDEEQILDIIGYNLRKAGYEVQVANNGVEGVKKAKEFIPDLILLDIMMPIKDGYQTIEEMRSFPSLDNTVIVFLTALEDEASEIKGLQLGADDYLAKPINIELLLARVEVALRKNKFSEVLTNQEEQAKTLDFGGFKINAYSYTVMHNNEEISLPRKEFELLSLLASKPGRVFLRPEILSKVWGSDVIVGDRTIDVHVRKIRQKIGANVITTVKGVGYKFELLEIE